MKETEDMEKTAKDIWISYVLPKDIRGSDNVVFNMEIRVKRREQ